MQSTPRVVIPAYAGFHDERNTFAQSHRLVVGLRNDLGPVVHPYARLERGDRLRIGLADVTYREFPLARHSAQMNSTEMIYSRLESNRLRSHAVSEALGAEIATLPQQHGASFIVANIASHGAGTKMLKLAARRGWTHVDIAVDARLPETTNRPHDGPPSAAAHRRYADGLEQVLRAELSTSALPPARE